MHASCSACTSQMPPEGVDTGFRCVWCPHLNACKPYLKHTFRFPCDNAIRSGGGYPGGSQCSVQAVQVSQSPSRPLSQPPPAFAHDRRHQVPVSVIIPSFARPSNLAHAIVWLLQLEPLHRTGSEVLISHGSARSLAAATEVGANVTRMCTSAAATSARRVCAPPHGTQDSNVRHIDAREWNSGTRHSASKQPPSRAQRCSCISMTIWCHRRRC